MSDNLPPDQYPNISQYPLPAHPSTALHQTLTTEHQRGTMLYMLNSATPAPDWTVQGMLPLDGSIVPGHTLCKWSGKVHSQKIGDDCRHLYQYCPTCSVIDQLCHRGMDAIYETPVEHRELLINHLQRRVDFANKRARDMQIGTLNWTREGLQHVISRFFPRDSF